MINFRYDRARQPRPTEIIVQQPTGNLARDIENICQLTGIALSRFGRDAVGDPRLYFDLCRTRRQPRQDTRVRILMHLNRLALDHRRKINARAGMAKLAGGNHA